MLPKLAATVIITTVKHVRRSDPSGRSASKARGTKVTSATSLVMSMLEKNARRVSARLSLRGERATASSRWHATANTPRRVSPAMMTMRLNSIPIVRRSM